MSYGKVKVSELDFFFMSLDEPNAMRHWGDLVNKVPWAEHVQGIVGFDAVHRYCGEKSTTPFLVTVDADTVIDPKFLNVEIELPYKDATNICWSSRNAVNGLTYGNGGIKIWRKDFARNMAFHELGSGIDFCWDKDFASINEVYSDIYINGSPLQAFRAGYREGVKLSTNFGERIKAEDLPDIHPYVLKLLKVWCSVGQDVVNGDWAILGARTGLVDNMTQRLKLEDVSDFNFIQSRFEQMQDVTECLKESEVLIRNHTPINIPIFTAQQSSFIKNTFSI